MSVRIETAAFKDIRFVLLGKRLGTTKYDAFGRMAELWEECTQRETYFLTEEMTNVIAGCENFVDLICDENIALGEKTERGIYIKGTNGRIEWIAKLRKNSRKGGKKTRAKWLANKPAKQEPKPRPEEGPSSSVSASSSVPVSSPVIIKKYSVGEAGLPTPSDKEKVQFFIGAYVKAHGTRFKSPDGEPLRPDLNDGKLRGEIANFAKAQDDIFRACALIQVFFQMEDDWFHKKAFDFGTFKSNLQKIALCLDTGKLKPGRTAADEWLEQRLRPSSAPPLTNGATA